MKMTDNQIETKEDAMIKATRKAEATPHELFDAFEQKGILGVYNLGLKHMYEYLKGNK